MSEKKLNCDAKEVMNIYNSQIASADRVVGSDFQCVRWMIWCQLTSLHHNTDR